MKPLPTSQTSVLTLPPLTMLTPTRMPTVVWAVLGWKRRTTQPCVHPIGQSLCFSIPFLLNLLLTKTYMISIICKTSLGSREDIIINMVHFRKRDTSVSCSRSSGAAHAGGLQFHTEMNFIWWIIK